MHVFGERGKLEDLGENISVQRREPTNSTHIWPESENLTRATLLGGDCSYHYATTALSIFISTAYLVLFDWNHGF